MSQWSSCSTATKWCSAAAKLASEGSKPDCTANSHLSQCSGVWQGHTPDLARPGSYRTFASLVVPTEANDLSNVPTNASLEEQAEQLSEGSQHFDEIWRSRRRGLGE